MTTIDAKVEEIKPGAARERANNPEQSAQAEEAAETEQTQAESAADVSNLEAVEPVETGNETGKKSKFKVFSTGVVAGVLLSVCIGSVPVYYGFDSARTTEQALTASQQSLALATDRLAEAQSALREAQAAKKSLEINIAQSQLQALAAELDDINAKEKAYQALLATKSKVISKKMDSQKRVDELTEELMQISNAQ